MLLIALLRYCFHSLRCNLLTLRFAWTASTMALEDPTTAQREQSLSDPEDPMADHETLQDYKKSVAN